MDRAIYTCAIGSRLDHPIIMVNRSTITLQLDSAAGFLNGHTAAPGETSPLPHSGLDELWAAVRSIPDDHALDIVLRLPAAELESEIETTIQRALVEQCTERIETYEGMCNEIRENTLSRLVTTLFIVVTAIAILIFLLFALPALEFLTGALGGIMALGVWAVLRAPINTYWRRWRPYRLEIANCRQIMTATINVEAA